MNAEKKVLICGGGIAGPTCAYWLHKYGYTVVVAEKAEKLRAGGQNIDVKGPAQEVIELMELNEAVDAKNTLESGHQILDADGKVVARFPKGSIGSLTQDFEILRGDFAQILYDMTYEQCEYRFGTSVAEVEEKDDCTSVTFNDGMTEDFEVVICAEGINSSTRKKVLAHDVHFRFLGAYMAFFSIPRRPQDDYWANIVNGKGGTFIALRPGNHGETTVIVTFLSRDPSVPRDDIVQKHLLRKALQGRGVVAERVIAELDAVDDFWFGPMSQVQPSIWSKGRFVLLGDAAYAPTPFTGTGTALALVGAYVLAGEIKKCGDYAKAFDSYERLMRPYVAVTQKKLSPSLIRILHAKSRLEIALSHAAWRVMAKSATQRLLKLREESNKDNMTGDIVLPNYS
ncbi:FAD-dependent monooxygenase [Mycolicibacterium sp. A43C]